MIDPCEYSEAIYPKQVAYLVDHIKNNNCRCKVRKARKCMCNVNIMQATFTDTDLALWGSLSSKTDVWLLVLIMNLNIQILLQP